MADRNLALKLLISAQDGASRVLTGIAGTVDRVGTAAKRAAVDLAKIGGALTAAAAAAGTWAMGRLLGESADAAERLEAQMAVLRQAVQQTGGAAGLSAEEISAMAEDLDAATLGSAASIRDAAASLLSFRKVGRDAFGTVLELALDLEAQGLGGFEDNVKQLG